MKKILVLISQGSELLEIAPFTDIFGWNNIVGCEKILLETCSLHFTIQTTWNLQITPEINLMTTKIDVNDYCALVVPGGFGYRGYFNDMKNPLFSHIIQQFFKNNKIIIGICTGVIPLGEAGILKNQKATTYLYDNERYFKQLSEYGAIPIKKPIVINDNLITVSGPKNAIEIAFYLLEILTSSENTNYVKYNMGF